MYKRDVLPASIKPVHYALTITHLDCKKWTFQASVKIDLKSSEPTKTIVLNAHELKLTKASVSLGKEAHSIEAASIEYNKTSQRVTLTFDKELPASTDLSAHIEFEGIINDAMAGFSRSKYKPLDPPAASVPRDDDWHYMLSTQFESCDAQRAFPCFDEPNLKATFDFAIAIPDDLVALSNMPVSSIKKQSDNTNLVSFERTPVMSTYLLAWAVGDFEYVEKLTDRKYNGVQIPVRVYATRGLAHQGEWALQHAGAIIDFFSETFGVDYPLPKADLLAVHEFAFGAMENWGLVTYRTTAVLFNEETSDTAYRQRVAYVVAHELAHMWFGNLVTMDWWDELWLNESFATWVGWHAVHHLHPEWQVWSQFVQSEMESGLQLDSIRSSHPVSVPIPDALLVGQIFDAISYEKGSCIIRMLADNLGLDKFLAGVSIYLKRHAYGNATKTDLWAALSEATGSDVSFITGSWIENIGHPVLTVKEDEPGKLSLRQNRFLSSGDLRAEEDETLWWIPLALRGKKGHDGVLAQSLTKRDETVSDVDSDFYLINSGCPGFYRVNYPPARLQRLGTQLNRLSELDKIGLISSASTLAMAGSSTTATLLSFLQEFEGETSQIVWTKTLGVIGKIRNIFGSSSEIDDGLKRYTLRLINKALSSVNWDFPKDEGYLATLLRKLLLGTAASSGHPEIEKECLRRFQAWLDDPKANPLHQNLRGIIFSTAARKLPKEAIPALKHEWHSTISVDGKAICLQALGCVTDKAALEAQVLPFLFDASPPASAAESVPRGDMSALGASLDRNIHARRLHWDTFVDRYDEVLAKLYVVNLDRYVSHAFGGLVTMQDVKDIESFFATKDTRTIDRTVSVVLDSIRARAMYRERERDGENIHQWLAENGYLGDGKKDDLK